MYNSYKYGVTNTVPSGSFPGYGEVNPDPSDYPGTGPIMGKLEGELLSGTVDSHGGVAAYTPIIHNIPVKAHNFVYNSNGKPDRNKTMTTLPGLIPKGTLVAFMKPDSSLLKYIPTQDGSALVDRLKRDTDKSNRNPIFSNVRRMRRDPTAIAEVFFNEAKYRPTISGKNIPGEKRFDLDMSSITAILPVAEQTEIVWGKNSHIAVAVYDTTEIAIPKGNPPLFAFPGDMIYCILNKDASITLHSRVVGGESAWQLGVAINGIQYADARTGDPTCVIALRPTRV